VVSVTLPTKSNWTVGTASTDELERIARYHNTAESFRAAAEQEIGRRSCSTFSGNGDCPVCGKPPKDWKAAA
jgi:hypothetical protein